MKKYRLLYFGTWGYGRAGLEALLELSNVQLVKVFSKWDLQNDHPYLNQVYHKAKAHDIPLINTDKAQLSKTAFQSAVLNSGEVDFILSCCYDRIFPTAVLDYPQIGALNVHPSLLPKYRGIKPLENAIWNGESEMGVTLHELVQELDAGDIVLQKAAPIEQTQSFGALYQEQCKLIRAILADFFTNPETYFANKQPQDHTQKSDAPRLPFAIQDEDTVQSIMQRHS